MSDEKLLNILNEAKDSLDKLSPNEPIQISLRETDPKTLGISDEDIEMINNLGLKLYRKIADDGNNVYGVLENKYRGYHSDYVSHVKNEAYKVVTLAYKIFLQQDKSTIWK